MEERKSNLLSRFWPPSASRRSSTTQTAPTTTSTRKTESQPNSQTGPTSAPPTRAQTKTPARQSTAKARKGDRASPKPRKLPPREVQKTSQQSTTPPTDKPKISSKPASTSRLSPQSRSPTQPSSPSHAAPKEPSKPHSPLRTPSRSPKQGEGTLPASPSKGSTQQEPSPIEKDSKPAAPQQEPEMTEEVKPDSPKVVNEPPSELEAKPEESKDVKEVVQATNVEANEETKKEVTYSAAPKSLSEAQVVEKQEALDTKPILETPTNATCSQPTDRNKSSDKSALPNGKQVPSHKNTKADMSDFANKMAKRDPAKAISDRPVSVITLAGDNRGASMQMESDSSKREGPIHINRGYKINPADESHDGEERSSKGKESQEERSVEEELTEAYVNNNAQGINNSIVFNSSIVEGNPGVHLVFSHLPKEPIQPKDKTSFPEARKSEVNMSRSEKLTYQPTVRRRCLRGLLMETSESDPEKPRRHGCRVSCQKENKMDVL